MAENVGGIFYEVSADTSGLLRAEKDVDRSTDKMERSFKGSTQATNRQGEALGKLNPVTRSVRQEMERLSKQNNTLTSATNMAKNAITGLIGALSVREVIRYADAWQNAENQLKQVTTGTRDLEAVQRRLVSVARDTRANFESTANLYARLARSTTELGLSQEDLIGLTTTINQSFSTSGATAEEASAAITQLSQGLAAGALRGDEFNSVSEQAPDIMRAIAASLNMTIGELRAFAAEGGITAEIVVNALQGASDEIGGRFAGSVATFGQQLEVARTNLIEWVGSSEEVKAAVRTLGSAIVTLSENMDAIVNIGKAVASLYGGRLAAQLIVGAGAMTRAGIAAAGAARGIGLITVAVRALTSATGLGLLIGAGGLLFSFRDELGLTTSKAGLTEDQIADLRAELQGMSNDDLSGSLSELNAELDQATLKAASAREELANLRAEQDQGQGPRAAFRELEAGGYGAEVAALRAVENAESKLLEIEQRRNAANIETIARWNESNQAASEAAGATEDYSGEVDKLRLSLDSGYAAQQKYNEAIETLDKALAAGNITQQQYNDLRAKAQEQMESATGAAKENAAATKEQERAEQQRAESLSALVDQLYPLNAAQREYNEQQTMVDEAVQAGLISDKADAQNRLAEAYRNTVTSLGGFNDAIAAYPSIFDPEGQEKEKDAEKDPFAEWLSSAENAFTDFDQLNADMASNFTSSFGRMFSDVLMQQSSFKDGFQSLMQGLVSSVVAGIGEMIAQWLAYQAVTSVIGFGAGGGSGGIFGGLLGGFAGFKDKGGRVGANEWAIAGENGPEIITGSANVVSTNDTARLMAAGTSRYTPSANQGASMPQVAPVTVNVNNNGNSSVDVQERTSDDGSRIVDVVISDISRDGRIHSAMQRKYGVQTRGR